MDYTLVVRLLFTFLWRFVPSYEILSAQGWVFRDLAISFELVLQHLLAQVTEKAVVVDPLAALSEGVEGICVLLSIRLSGSGGSDRVVFFLQLSVIFSWKFAWSLSPARQLQARANALLGFSRLSPDEAGIPGLSVVPLLASLLRVGLHLGQPQLASLQG